MTKELPRSMSFFDWLCASAQNKSGAGRSARSVMTRGVGLAVAAVALLGAGCGGDALWAINNDCDEEIAATVRDLGPPDSITKVSNWDTDVVIYVYRSIGLIRSFEWGPYRDCKGKDETFTPR